MGILLAVMAISHWPQRRQAKGKAVPKVRRILYNNDGDSCMFLKKNSKGPAIVTAEDLKRIVEEIAYPGGQVDTLLLYINSQSTYYPSKVGSMRGTECTPEERKHWPDTEKQRFSNVEVMFAQGVDPYAVVLAEAKRRGIEALLSYRMNDAHGFNYLHCKLYRQHPEYRLGAGLDFGREAVHDYTFRIIEEAVQRYDCDGIELDFNRFPNFFKDGKSEERIAKINSLVERIRAMIDSESKRRNRHLVLAARVPTSYKQCLAIGCDPVFWAKDGWIDFLAVSECLVERYDLPIAPWKKLIQNIPIYGSIEVVNADRSGPRLGLLSPADYRRATRHLWADAPMESTCSTSSAREKRRQGVEPPFERA